MKKMVPLLTLIAVLSMGLVAAAQSEEPVVYLNPAFGEVDITEQIAVEVWISDVTDFYGVEFELIYDPAIVDALSVVEGSAFTDWPDEYEVVQANVGGGLVEFAASLLATPKAPPLSGDLHLATITFDPVAEGVSDLLWAEIKVSDSAGDPIDFAYLDGSITVVYMGDVRGDAYLEGRSNHVDIAVDLVNGTVATTMTDSWGDYGFDDVISGLYDLSFEHDMYLSAELTGCAVAGGVTNYLPAVTLLAGDLNNDEVIDILDLSFCAFHFNEVYADADANADGIVDIFDIVLIGKNFGQTGPTVFTCP
jgi:hypothetical protein